VYGSHRGEQWKTLTQNYPDGIVPDGRSGILRITQDDNPVPNGGIFGDEFPLDMYYAYGIRNMLLHSDKLGAQYQNDMFVGDVPNGRLSRFDLNKDRTALVLPEALADKIIDTPNSSGLDQIIFGQGFAGITDIEVGHDDYLYVVNRAG
jgi:hypothetical protein